MEDIPTEHGRRFLVLGVPVDCSGAGVLFSSCGGACGLFVFLPIISGLHVAVFGVSSYYMEKFKPGGGWCSVFVEKTNTEKETRKRVKIFRKSIDTDTETCYITITDTETC